MNQAGTITLVTHIQHTQNHIPVHILFDLCTGYSDIAVLQISQNASQPQRQLLSYLKPLVLGNSSNPEVADTVIAIGNPFGLSDAMTIGIVSGIGRSIPISVGYLRHETYCVIYLLILKG